MNRAIKEKEEELVGLLLASVQDMRIKFPGKTDEEAEQILDKIITDWKFHKPRVASYWLVKLDSIKRRKVCQRLMSLNFCISYPLRLLRGLKLTAKLIVLAINVINLCKLLIFKQ